MNQVLHYANQGVTIKIHNVPQLPKDRGRKWHCRGYHGSPEHNTRGVIQQLSRSGLQSRRRFNPLSPSGSAPLYVRDDGRLDKIMKRGQQLHDEESKYLLASEIMNKLDAGAAGQRAGDLLADIFRAARCNRKIQVWNSFPWPYELRNWHPVRL